MRFPDYDHKAPRCSGGQPMLFLVAYLGLLLFLLAWRTDGGSATIHWLAIWLAPVPFLAVYHRHPHLGPVPTWPRCNARALAWPVIAAWKCVRW